MKGEPKVFLFRRWIHGAWYGGEVSAENHEDAAAWCKRAGVTLDGELKMRIPAVTGAWLPNFIIAVRNAFARRP